MNFNRNPGPGQKRSRPVSGLGAGPNKRHGFGPDLSALPTHLPGSGNAPLGSKFPSHSGPSSLPSIPSLPPIPNFAKSQVNLEPRPVSEPVSEPSSVVNEPVANEPETLPIVVPQNGENLNEEKAKPKASSEPVFIEGTNISLQTEEDIAKWIAERKKRWPTRKNVESKLQEQKEQKEREVELPLTAPKHQNICKFYARSGRCKFGSKCRNVHEAGTGTGTPGNKNGNKGGQNQAQSGSSARKIINGVAVNIPQRYKKEVNGAGSLFTKLVQRDLYEHENNIVMDFIQYLDSKGLIKHDANA